MVNLEPTRQCGVSSDARGGRLLNPYDLEGLGRRGILELHLTLKGCKKKKKNPSMVGESVQTTGATDHCSAGTRCVQAQLLGSSRGTEYTIVKY